MKRLIAATINASRLMAGTIQADAITVPIFGAGDFSFDHGTRSLRVNSPDGKVSMNPSFREHLPSQIYDLDIEYPCPQCGRDLLFNKKDHVSCDGCGAPLSRTKPRVAPGGSCRRPIRKKASPK